MGTVSAHVRYVFGTSRHQVCRKGVSNTWTWENFAKFTQAAKSRFQVLETPERCSTRRQHPALRHIDDACGARERRMLRCLTGGVAPLLRSSAVRASSGERDAGQRSPTGKHVELDGSRRRRRCPHALAASGEAPKCAATWPLPHSARCPLLKAHVVPHAVCWNAPTRKRCLRLLFHVLPYLWELAYRDFWHILVFPATQGRRKLRASAGESS